MPPKNAGNSSQASPKTSRGGRKYVKKGIREPHSTRTAETAKATIDDIVSRSVKTMAQIGMGWRAIAARLGKDRNTLMRDYGEAYASGRSDGEGALKQCAYAAALGAPAAFDTQGRKIREEIKPDPKMAFEIINRRFGWREDEDANGLPYSPDAISDDDLRNLPDDVLAELLASNQKALASLSRVVAQERPDPAFARNITPQAKRGARG